MDERGGQKQIKKTFLIDRVRHLSRLYTGKNNGQEPIWDKTPTGWPSHLTWKNPTSTPKDNVETLLAKYNFLFSVVENISDSDKKVHNDFISDNMKAVESHLLCTKFREQVKAFITNIDKDQILDNKDLSETLNELCTKISSLKPCSQKRQNEDPVGVPHKKIKTMDQNVKVANKTKQTCGGALRPILPKSLQAASIAHSTHQVTSMPLGLHYVSGNTVSNIDSSPQTLTYCINNPASVPHTFNNNAQNNSKDSTVQCLPPSSPLMHPTSNYNEDSPGQWLTHSSPSMHPIHNCRKDSLDQCLTPSPALMHPTSNCNEDSLDQFLTPTPPIMHHTNNSNSQNKSSEDSTKANNFNPEISNNNTLSIESNNTSDIENLEDFLDPEILDFLNSESLGYLLDPENQNDNFNPGNQDDNFNPGNQDNNFNPGNQDDNFDPENHYGSFDPKQFINFPKT